LLEELLEVASVRDGAGIFGIMEQQSWLLQVSHRLTEGRLGNQLLPATNAAIQSLLRIVGQD
jgi:hypothetical protein